MRDVTPVPVSHTPLFITHSQYGDKHLDWHF